MFWKCSVCGTIETTTEFASSVIHMHNREMVALVAYRNLYECKYGYKPADQVTALNVVVPPEPEPAA